MTLDLAEIKAAAEAATPGPWQINDTFNGHASEPWVSEAPDDGLGTHLLLQVDGDRQQADLEFIALSRTAVPWLVERVEELAEALRIICDIGETRDVEVARAALARLESET